MPRIRILKNYDAIQPNYIEESSGEDDAEPKYKEPEKGWWSSPRIISCLSDSKIKASILYHQQQIKFLEEELLSRSSFHMVPSSQNYGNHETNRKQYRSGTRKDRQVKSFVKTLNLNEEQQKYLIKNWNLIIDFYNLK